MFCETKNSILKMFNVLADKLEQFKENVIQILTKTETYQTAENEVDKTIRTLRTYVKEEVYLKDREPVGKVAIFLPFNMPLYSLVLYSFGSIYAGNEVYVRPSRITRDVLLEICELFSVELQELPLYIIEKSGREFLNEIFLDPEFATIVFTGQWESVNDIVTALPSGKKLIYSGSGLCPFIVRRDADLELAVQALVKSKIFNSGQDCLATERVYIHEDVFEPFIHLLKKMVDELVVGENKNPKTDIGKLATLEFANRVKEGLKATRGHIVKSGNVADGVVEPMIICVEDDDPLFKMEKFSPVFTLVKYSKDEELIKSLNESEYALGISVFGSEFVNDKLPKSHIVYNGTVLDFEEEDAHIPFGGYKKSGFVIKDGKRTEGPILFSYETTTNKEIDKMKKKMYINGQWKESANGMYFNSFNPATGEKIAEIPEASIDDINDAVSAARNAYNTVWSKINPAERSGYLYKIADLIEKHGDELAYLDMIDAGKPILDCKFDIPACVDIFRFHAGAVDKVQGKTYPVQKGSFAYSIREPYGVVAAIIPWNYPIYNACLKVAPILAMGNCCILKPAEQTSLSALKLAEIIEEAGLPAGVFNVVTGDGETAGSALSKHLDVDMISFTGSTDVGREIIKASAQSNIKKMSLELGGKSPFIIFEDADIDKAVDSACMTIFYNQGQTCTAGSRLFVQKSIKEKVISVILEKVKKIVVGNPSAEDVHLGAIVSKEQYDKVLSYIELAKEEGAKLLFGGKSLNIEGCEQGNFISPTVFDNVKNNMRIAQEEIFGPVMCIIEFENEEEIIEAANNTTYGLATSIWTNNSARLIRMINSINAGIVWSNCVARENVGVPVGGFKQSGFGKESGLESCIEYTREKTVWINTSDEYLNWID